MKKLILTCSALLSMSVFAAFTPYAGEPPQVTLTAAQQSQMAAGKLVYILDNQDGEIKEGSIAFRVNAAPAKVWKVLSDFSKYPEWSYRVGGAVLYKATQGDTMYVDFTTDSLGKHYYVINKMPMGEWSTWRIDTSKDNDCVVDTVGYWRVKAVAGNANQSDVIQYGKLQLTSLCANGFFGIGGFDGHEMAETVSKNLKLRAEKL